MARITKKTVSLFDTTTTPEQDVVGQWLHLKELLSLTDEASVQECQDNVCDITENLLKFVKENFATACESISASMATGSDMTQDMAVDTVMSLIGAKTGYDKLEVQLFICSYANLLCRVNELMRSGNQCYLSIALACREMNVAYLPANVRTLFNACIVYSKKGDDSLMHWVFWTPKCRTRNAVATHAIAQGCFIRSNGREYLFTPGMKQVEMETREAPNTRGELVQKPVIDYQWEAKSQRVLTFWERVGIKDDMWEKTLVLFDDKAKEHIVTFKASQVENLAKASTKGAVKGLEAPKKAPNAVKIRNARLKKLFDDMDF